MGRLWQRFALHPYRNWLQNSNFSEHLVAEGHALLEVPQHGEQVLSKDGTNSTGAAAEARKSTQDRRMIRNRQQCKRSSWARISAAPRGEHVPATPEQVVGRQVRWGSCWKDRTKA